MIVETAPLWSTSQISGRMSEDDSLNQMLRQLCTGLMGLDIVLRVLAHGFRMMRSRMGWYNGWDLILVTVLVVCAVALQLAPAEAS